MKKPTAAKKTAAKKTAAKKTPAKTAAPAKKSASASKKEPAKNMETLATNLATAIRDGQFDGYVALLDNAITDRINEQAASGAKKSTAKKSEGKSVSSAPKRGAKKSEAVVLEGGKTYKISSALKKLAGAKVKFIRFKVDAEDKAVVEMMVDKPGYPKGKRAVVPVGVLSAAK